MCDTSIRRLAAQEREEEEYRSLFAQVDEKLRLEYEVSFGPTYRQLYPYKSDWQLIDKVVTKMMRSAWA